MSKRKHHINVSTSPNTKDKEWLMENVPMRTLTRWKKRKINRTLIDIEKHTEQQDESDEDACQIEEQRAEPFTSSHESDEDASQIEEQRAEPFTSSQESDEDASQTEDQTAEPFTSSHESDEDASQIEEQRAEPFTSSQESDEDASQTEDQRAEPFTLAQKSDEDASQTEEQREEPFTLAQDNVPQDIDDVHSHGLTEGQSCISILSFALRHYWCTDGRPAETSEVTFCWDKCSSSKQVFFGETISWYCRSI